MQAKPPRANVAAASSEVRAAQDLGLHGVFITPDDMDRMVNGELLPPSHPIYARLSTPGRCGPGRAAPAVFRRQFSSDSGSSSAASTRLRPLRLAW
jgi:hypothetical protein